MRSKKNKQLANTYPCCIDPCYFTKYNNWEQLFSAKSNTFKAKRYSADAVRNAFRCRRKNMETRGHREPDLEDIEFQFEDHDFIMQLSFRRDEDILFSPSSFNDFAN